MEIFNRRAKFDYFIEKEYEAGIVLLGTEIKSIRKGSCDIKEAYARIKDDEVFIINMYIARYEQGNRFNHNERRSRKLLLHKREIKKIKEHIEREGYSLIPLKLYIHKGKAKLLLGIGKGKKNHDKRASLKEKTIRREIESKVY